MDNRRKILKLFETRASIKASDLANTLKISRQKATKHLSRLVKEGLATKEGSTRNSIYKWGKGESIHALKKLHLVKSLKNLQEDRVYGEAELKLGLKKLPESVQNIIFYAFGEMLNNAIDHSKSEKTEMTISLDKENVNFKIRDQGIGIFANVKKKFHLHNEFEALEHVLKGKQTTFPERHSGQGIFFTSRIADIFKIRSHKIEIIKNNFTDDLIMKDVRTIKGTEIYFQIKRRSRKILKGLFAEYADEEYVFDRTSVKIHITAERELLARSQAKRILVGLEKYKIITLDFKKIKEIGQAFVDEVFRVYKERHPGIQINYINASPAVEFMIQRGAKG